jgi:hypothetical protein
VPSVLKWSIVTRARRGRLSASSHKTVHCFQQSASQQRSAQFHTRSHSCVHCCSVAVLCAPVCCARFCVHWFAATCLPPRVRLETVNCVDARCAAGRHGRAPRAVGRRAGPHRHAGALGGGAAPAHERELGVSPGSAASPRCPTAHHPPLPAQPSYTGFASIFGAAIAEAADAAGPAGGDGAGRDLALRDLPRAAVRQGARRAELPQSLHSPC